MLHNIKLQVSQFESSSSMAPFDNNEGTRHQSFLKFQKQNNNFIKINNNYSNHIDTQLVATTLGVDHLSSIITHCNFTHLFESLHIIILILINASVMKLSLVKTIDTSKNVLVIFDPIAFFQYHRQPVHAIEKCYRLKHVIQDLIDFDIIIVEGVNDKENKYVAPLNQNLQIFTNPLPSHSTNVIEPRPSTNIALYDMCVEANNVVNLIGQSKPKLEPCNTFDSRETIDGWTIIHYYKIKGNLS